MIKTYPVPLAVQDTPGLQQEHLVDLLLVHRRPKVSSVGVHLFRTDCQQQDYRATRQSTAS